MADIDLEARQVVGEEAEAASGRRGLLANRKRVAILLAAFVVEGVILFFVFDALGKGSGHAIEPQGESHGTAHAETRAPDPRETVSSLGEYLQPREIPLGEIAIWDESDPTPKADRRFSAQFTIWVDSATMTEIEKATEQNPDALNRVKDALRGTVREWMLRSGGEALRTLDMQSKGKEKLKDFINDNLAPLRNRIVTVSIDNFRPSRG